jgi:hypothetical protein
MNNISPGLFGLNQPRTNRDFTQKDSWGKNQFNSSFPAAMCCYLSSKAINANYLQISKGKFKAGLISIRDALGIDAADKDAYFAFETPYTPYQKYVIGSLPRTDLVMQKSSTNECLSGLEVKLTALPDTTTCDQKENYYGCEIVVRPDTIVYLACSIASSLGKGLNDFLPDIKIDEWTEPRNILRHANAIISSIERIAIEVELTQNSFLIQPVWKTKGKSPELADNCLDVFIWSNAAFCFFISEIARRSPDPSGISRHVRTAIWLFKMLQDIKIKGKFDYQRITDELSYNTRNDKAFASSGNVTNKYMQCPRLIKPVVHRDEIKNIILGGGQHLLSPERRFDAILFNSPGLFE